MILQKKVPGLNESVLQRFLLRARRAAGLRGTVNLLLTTSSRMRVLNARFRGKDKPTDVLSFPAASHSASRRNSLAGEIAISADIAAANAARLGHSVALEVKVLALHGILHLAGFDHERDNGRMARKELLLRHALHLPSTLLERGEASMHSAKAQSRRSRRPA